MTRSERLQAVLIGTALGDSVGLPAEGLSRERIAKLGWRGSWRQRFFFGRGMCSDDTEHSVMVLQSILEADGDVEVFRRRFARRLRWWLLGLPAGVGMATARAGIKLWFGFTPLRSGVFSAGNGPAMRSGIIGAFYADDPERRAELVEASTLLTHTDPKALIGAMAIAELVAGPTLDKAVAIQRMRDLGGDEEWIVLIDQLESGIERGHGVEEFAQAIGAGQGVSGYVYQTVPVAIYSWLLHQGCGERAVSAVLDCGGDTDTVAAITGALCGASGGVDSFPGSWSERLIEWPRGIKFFERLAKCPSKVPKAFWGAILLRNLFFLVVVLLHGILRFVPGGLGVLR